MTGPEKEKGPTLKELLLAPEPRADILSRSAVPYGTAIGRI